MVWCHASMHLVTLNPLNSKHCLYVEDESTWDERDTDDRPAMMQKYELPRFGARALASLFCTACVEDESTWDETDSDDIYRYDAEI